MSIWFNEVDVGLQMGFGIYYDNATFAWMSIECGHICKMPRYVKTYKCCECGRIEVSEWCIICKQGLP